MPSLVTSVIGGIQGASAAHNAARALQQGYTQAGQTVQQAVSQVNPEILAAAKAAGIDLTGAAQAAGANLTGTAAAGAAGATGAAQQFAAVLSPYVQGGAAAMGNLSAAMGPGGYLTTPFNASMMAQYSPAYQFQLQQGMEAANRAAAAQGLTGAGGTARALERYTQDYANTAFQSAAGLYGQQQRDIYGRLAGVAGMGQAAAGATGQAGQQAAEFGAGLTTGAARTAGGWGVGAAEQGGQWGINAANLAASNTLSGANYLANTQIAGQQALAQGDLGAAASWNNMLSGIGSAANAALAGGLTGGLGGALTGGLSSVMGGGSGGGGGNFTRYASANPWSGIPPNPGAAPQYVNAPNVSIPNLPDYLTNAPSNVRPQWGSYDYGG